MDTRPEYIIKETTNIRGITPEMSSSSATITDAEYYMYTINTTMSDPSTKHRSLLVAQLFSIPRSHTVIIL